MGAMTIAVIVICALAGTYLYVTGLCYICDLYSLQKAKKLKKAEERRKEQLHIALEQAEARRKEEIARRKQLARARRERGLVSTESLSRKSSRQNPASAAHA